MWDVIVLIPDHCFSIYFSFLCSIICDFVIGLSRYVIDHCSYRSSLTFLGLQIMEHRNETLQTKIGVVGWCDGAG